MDCSTILSCPTHEHNEGAHIYAQWDEDKNDTRLDGSAWLQFSKSGRPDISGEKGSKKISLSLD